MKKNDDSVTDITVVTIDGTSYKGNNFEYKDSLFVLACGSDCAKLFPKENIRYIEIRKINVGDIIGDI